MEVRKVQVTGGGSSYIITLPKNWVRSLNIKKNDPLGLIIQPDGTLLVTPRTTSERVQTTKEINVDKIDDPRFLFRLLIGAYIRGYNNIIIRSKNKIKPPIRDSIIHFTQLLIGPEIVEEDANSIVTKDLLSPTEMPLDKTVKRMYLLVNSMHEIAISSLKNRDRTLAEDVVNRDRDVDRLQWLIARQSNLILEDVTLSKKLGVTPSNVSYYVATSRILERVGDHAVIIAGNIPVLIDKGLDKKSVDTIVSASETSLKILAKSMEAWSKRDIHSANENIESVKSLVSRCEKINSQAMNVRGESAIALSYISDSIRRTGEYAGDISELLINQLIGD